MRKFSKSVATLAMVAAAATTFLFGAPAAHASNYTIYGCPSGYVCIYSDASWNTIIYKEQRAGAWNLSNMYGVHRVYNNQTGGWIVRLCLGWNGTNCNYTLNQDYYTDANLTPYNSIRISP